MATKITFELADPASPSKIGLPQSRTEVDATAFVLIPQAVELADGTLADGKPLRKGLSLAWIDEHLTQAQIEMAQAVGAMNDAQATIAERNVNIGRLQSWRDEIVKLGVKA